MPQFAYKARKRSGEIVQGVLDVADRTVALQQIERLGLFPVVVDNAKPGSASGGGAAAGGRGSDGSSRSMLPQSVRGMMNRM